ncbi:MAG: TetR/AcrR family transcriptional regulator [Pseudomonadota bacterium]
MKSNVTKIRRSAEEARQHLIEAAEAVFDREGLSGLSIRKLADESGYSPAALYKHFRDKGDLIICLKEAFFARVRKAMNRKGIAAHEAVNRLEEAMLIYIEEALAKPHHYAAAFSDEPPRMADNDEPLEEGTERGHAFQVFFGFVDEVMQAHKGPHEDTASAAQSLWAGMHGLCHLLVIYPLFPWVERDKLVNSHVKMLISGLIHPR